jgi:hypothetical protein
MGDKRKDHCYRGHELTPENTIVYSHGGRECRLCKYNRESNNRRMNRILKKRLGSHNLNSDNTMF